MNLKHRYGALLSCKIIDELVLLTRHTLIKEGRKEHRIHPVFERKAFHNKEKTSCMPIQIKL
jgi:hypothetical protein